MTTTTVKKKDTRAPRRAYVSLDRPLARGEVRHGILSRGQGTLVFDETDQQWLQRGQRSYVLRQFPHGRLRRTAGGRLRIRLEFDIEMETFDVIRLGQELGDIADYVCRYQERRRR